MTALVSVVVSGPPRPRSRDLAIVLEVELGVHRHRAESMAAAVRSGTSVTVFSGLRPVSAGLAQRLEGAGLSVDCVETGVVEAPPDVLSRPIPRRRSRS